MRHKSFGLLILFGTISIIGSDLIGDLSKTFSSTQRAGVLIMLVGMLCVGISYGWILRSEQPDIKAKKLESIITPSD